MPVNSNEFSAFDEALKKSEPSVPLKEDDFSAFDQALKKKVEKPSTITSKDSQVGVSDGTISTIEPPKSAADLFNLQDTKTREDLTNQGFDINKLNEDLKNIDFDLIREGEDATFTKDKILKEYKESPERYERDIASLKFTSLHRKAISELPKEEAVKFSQIFISSNKEENKKLAEDINKYGGNYKKELLENLSKITGEEYKFLENEVLNDNSEKGSRLGYIYNSFLNGIGSLSSGASDLMMQLLTNILPKEALGGTKEEVLAQWRQQAEPTIRTATSQLYGADVSENKQKQYEKEFFTSALGGLSSSIPMMVSPYGTGLFLGSYDAGLQSINNTKEGKKLPESTKTIFAIGVGTAGALLEKAGLDKIFGKQSKTAAINLATRTISELVDKSAAPITKEIFESALQSSVKSLKQKIINAGGKIGKGATIEFLTGGAQEGANVLAEKLTNLSQKKQIFEPKSNGEIAGRILYAGAQEALGGGIFGGVSAFTSKTRNYISEKVAEAKSEEDIAKLKDEVLAQAQKNNLGNDESNQLVQLIDNYAKINSKIPSDVENRKEVIEKIDERDELKKQIDQKKVELENADDAFKPNIQKELDAMQGRYDEMNEEVISASTTKESTPELPRIKEGDRVYRIDYTDPQTGQKTYKLFENQEEGTKFMNSVPGEAEGYYEKYDGKSIISTSEGAIKKGEPEVISKPIELSLEPVKVGEEVPQVPKAEEKPTLTGIEQEQTIKQMLPFTDKMVEVERQFKNEGFEIDTDYDNEIQVLDKNGEIVDMEELPDNLKKLASDYEKATMKLGEFDASAREKALAESRKVIEVEAEEVTPKAEAELPVAERENWTQDDYKKELKRLEKEDAKGNAEKIKQLQTELGAKLRSELVKPKKEKVEKVKVKTKEESSVQKALNENEEEGGTFNDLVDKIEGIAFDEENQNLQDAVDAYRKEQKEDFELAGRGDMDAAEAAFMSKIQAELPPTPEKATPKVEEEITPMEVEEEQPPFVEGGREVVTRSGLTEQGRQKLIAQRNKELKITDRVKDEQAILDIIERYNSLKKGRLGQQAPIGLDLLNKIRNKVGEFNQKYNADYEFGRATLLNDKNRTVKRKTLKDRDAEIDESRKTLRDRDLKTQEVFDDLFEAGAIPTGYTGDKMRMSESQLNATIQDILDGVPSRRANNYLDALEKQIREDDFDFSKSDDMPAYMRPQIKLDDVLGVSREDATQPMTEEMLNDWLSKESEVTPENQEVYDNIENLITYHETRNEPEGEVRPTPTPTKERVTEPTKPVTKEEKPSGKVAAEKPTAEKVEPKAELPEKNKFVKIANNQYSDGVETKYIVPTSNSELGGHIEVSKEVYEKWKELDDAEKMRIDRLKKSLMRSESQKQKEIRGVAMSFAAEKRRILGTETARETSAKEEKENKVRINDKATINNIEYTVLGFPYGKIKLSTKSESGVGQITIERGSDIEKQILKQKPKETVELKGEHIPNLDFYLSELNKEKELEKPKAETIKPIKPKEPTAEKVEPKAELPKEEKIGKFEQQARKIAEKISKAELPDFMKTPEFLKDAKKSGMSAEDLQKKLADAIILMGKLLDKGVEFSKALKEAVGELVNIRGEENRELIEKGFEDYYNSLTKAELPSEVKKVDFGEGEEAENNKKEFNNLTSTIPNTGEVTKYLSGETIKKYEGEEARNEQQVFVQQLREALVRGTDIVNKGREIFGEDYVQKLLDYVETENLPPANKALIYVSLENEVAKQKIENPSKAQQLEKLQDLVRAKSQAFLRSSSLAINFGRLRKIAEVWYDISRLTNDFFSSKQMEQKATIEKAIEATPDDINKQAEEIRRKIEEGIEEEIAKIYEKLPKEKKTYAEKALSALDKIQQKLRSKTYADFTGMTALIDAGITTIKAAIKAGVKVADAIELGINKIKESYKEKTGESWAKENEFRKDITEEFKSEGITEPKKGVSKSEFNRIEKEILELDRQIQKGEKDKFNQKESKESKALDKLRKEKEEKQAILEALDPTPKIFIENTLIEQGYGRQINIKTKEGVEKRWVLDWKKLAGEEGSVDNIRQKVEAALKDKGYTEEQILRMKDAFVEEYNNLRASIIEKSMNEIAAKNKQTVTPEQKAAAKKLAEMYNYGLFDKDPAEYELAIAKTLGLGIASQEAIKKAVEMGQAMSNMFNVNYEGRPLTESQLRTAIQVIEEKMRAILYAESMKEGNRFFRISNLAKIYMDMSQRMLLNTVKQGIENPMSGLFERFYSSIGYSGKIPSKLNEQQRKLARDIYKEMVLQKGIGYGNVGTAFVAKGNIDAYIEKMSDNQLINAVISMGMGKTILDAVDSSFKAKITQQKFTYNLIKILTQDRKINGKIEKGMSIDEAKKYVAEKISGQSFEDAKDTARKIIEKVNKDAGQKIFNDSELFVNRLATDIVNASLVNGEKITEEMVTAAYNAAYKAAGRGLGHVANNKISEAVNTVSGKLESEINDAIKEKNYTRAALLNFYSIFYRNIANPFVGGGTNWIVLKAEKTGLGLVSGLFSLANKKGKLDLSTENGLKQLENSLYEEMKIRDKFIRGAVGGAVTALTYLLIKGTDTDDKFEEWLKKNEWAKKYINIFTPEIALALMASKSEKSYKKYLESSFNKNEAFDKGAMAIKAATYLATGKKEEGYGKLGELVGGSVGTPIPWRLVRDGQQIYVGATGGKPYRVDPKPSKSFSVGFLKGGFIDYLGYAPKDKDLVFGGKMGEPGVKMLIDNGLELPNLPKIEDIKVNKDDRHPDGIMTKAEGEEYIKIWSKNLIIALNQIESALKSAKIKPTEEQLKELLGVAKEHATQNAKTIMIDKGAFEEREKEEPIDFMEEIKDMIKEIEPQ